MSDAEVQNMENEPAVKRWRWVTCVVVACGAATVGVISYFMGDLPWKFDWLDGNRPDGVLLAVAEEARIHISGIGMVGVFGCAWALLRKRGSWNEVSDEARAAYDKAVTAYEFSEADEVSGVDGSFIDIDDSGDLTRAVQEQVAKAGVDVLLEPSYAGLASSCEQAEQSVLNLEAENQLLKVQIDNAKMAKSSFLSTISHELRTPMNGIIGMSELLQGCNLAPRELGYVNTINASANSLMHSLGDILDYTRLASGELTLENSRFNLPECIEDVCEMLAETAYQRNNELVCYVDDDVPVMVDGDHNRIRQILNHIIGNAIAFTENGEVVVQLAVESNRQKVHTLRCTVNDTGVGISPEQQIVLFDAFSQEDNSVTRTHEGLGLGLAVSRELVSEMNGVMSFSSRLGEGTSMSFTLELTEIDGEISTDKQPMLHGAKVLLVDDNETNRTILSHQLSRWGVITVSADSGEKALEALTAALNNGDEFDALILDMHMPEMDGLTLAKTIRDDEKLPNVRSLLLTSAVVDETPEQLASLGIEKYISKPVRQSLLRTSLLSLMPKTFKRSAKQYSEMTGRFTYLPIEASVLLVEDNLISQDVTVGLLESFGCEVDVVDDGREAVSRCELNDYDIVFMDCELPTLSGFDTTEAIREIPSGRSSVIVVALTALAMAGDREKCMASGMNDYLSKPLNQDELYATLMRWCSDKLVRDGSADDETNLYDAGSQEPLRDGLLTKTETRSLEVVNVSALEAIQNLQRPDNDNLLDNVISSYLEKSPELVAEVKDSLDAGHFAELNVSIHTLKSSSAYVGAEQLVVLCDQIERAMSANDESKLADLVDTMPDVYLDVENFLTDYTQQYPKAA